ncbi:ATP-dependent helicase [Methylocystis sp. L43]|uniref:ATP-dependent helicase n=1 Tax=unclassified Methylocystis TaxID=2625913 RepID=UPI0018C266E2|nr:MULTISPECIES: ATP-dependent helicase [unclassified Methylocystis]MBG0796646.1 ATP-dependent helicase [Methylocystis sp. L43]MBG0804635.1 ATP-dependent helicase [Methylocystis sp. H15]
MTDSALSVAMSELTEAQAVAVAWRDGPMFVLAGPGSGKTRVLTTRVAKLLADTPDRSFRVLALTFTNKAADEMSGRVTALVPEQERRALVGTFHSFCMQMLQQHGSHIGINPDFAIYSLDVDRQEILRDAIKQAGLAADDIRLLSTIDKLKSRLVQPSGSARYFRDPSDGKRVEQVYTAYEDALTRANALDFGSLIAQAHRLVTSFHGIAVRYRKTYAYWMFDEFQDTTDGQYQLIRALAGEDFKNVFAVADDDQIIYQWNGASYQQIQRFRADFSPQELQLPTNYRCPPAIVAAANHLVVHNIQRTTAKQPLEAGKTSLRYPNEQHIRVLRYSTDEVEAASIAEGISKIDRARWGEVTVLARTRYLLEKLQAALTRKQVSAVISQRRDDFRSPQFLWLAAVLRQALRPLDRRALEILTGAFNRWFGTDTRVDLIITATELTERSLLDEWAVAVKAALSENPGAIALVDLAAKFAKEPTRFRSFIEAVLTRIPAQDDESSDIAEDRAAWSDLVRSIGKTLGRDAPLEQFLQELAIRSKEAPVGKNTVTLMTIHGAKGKEFDHVYVVGLAEDILPSFQSLKAGENSPEMEEERRNCFVAITRAREWLCLSYADSYRGWGKQPSRFLREMGVDLPVTPAG